MNKKLLFNHLLIHYNKSLGKLKRLSEKGLNFRRQMILGKRIERIKRQLISIKYTLTKGLAMASFAGGVAMLQPEIANAQNFQPPVVNPFSLNLTSDSIGNIKSVDYADLDADGDIDIVVYSSSLDKLALIKNIGTPEIPEFGMSELIPVSLTEIETLNNICLGDIDLDGDFDLMGGGNNGNFIYFENIGTDSLLEYSEGVSNPFALTNTYNFDTDFIDYYIQFIGENILEFADLDGDGDFDIFTRTHFYDNETYGTGSDYDPFGVFGDFYRVYYFENIGTSMSPEFAAKVSSFQGFSGLGDLGDVDLDGDFDYTTGMYQYIGYYGELYGNFIYYLENIGNDSLPEFLGLQLNAFGLGTIIEEFLTSPSFVDFDYDNDVDLIFLKAPYDFYFYENKICDFDTNNIITLNEGVLTAEVLSASYQWYSNDYPFPYEIPGATNQNYTPYSENEYSVLINKENCQFMSNYFYFVNCNDIYYNGIYSNDFTLSTFNGDNYQWLDCNEDYSPILGETLYFYTPPVSGNYAVEVNYLYCKDTTDCYNFTICENFSVDISADQNIIVAEPAGASYQWLDCNNNSYPILNETSNSFIPSIAGSYAAQISISYCTDTTECYDFTICETLSSGIIISGNTLTLEQNSGTYQWINCNNLDLLEGETNQTFTPTISGSYNAYIRYNNCYYQTECIDVTITNINDFATTNQFSIIPNPTNGILNIRVSKPLQNAVMQIKSVTGQMVAEQNNISGSSFVFDLANHVNGLYFIEVTDGGFTTHLKIVKE